MGKKTKKTLFEWVKIVLTVLILFFLLHTYIFSSSLIEGKSMYPTINDGERIIYNKIVYMNNQPARGDIVIIKRPLKHFVKRIIGLPNETVEIKDQQLLINGIAYQQSFLTSSQTFFTPNFGPVTIPDNSYFVMGDNRKLSVDSRNGLGFVEKDEIIGRSEFIIYPFFEWRSLE